MPPTIKPRVPQILLFGSGAVGAIYVYILQKAGCQVTTVCRSNYTAVLESGLHISSAIFGEQVVRPHKVVRTVDEAVSSLSTSSSNAISDTQGEYFDFVIVCSKAFPPSPGGESAAASSAAPTTADLISPAVTPSLTTIALIQNGIGIEEEYSARFPSNPLLSCVVYLPVTQTKPGCIEMGPVELLEIGPYISASTPPSVAPSTPEEMQPAETLANLVTAGGGTALAYPRIQPRRWAKMLINATWNPMCALSLSSDVEVMAASEVATGYVRACMSEVVSLAAAVLGDGEGVTERDADVALSRAVERVGQGNGRGIEPSMLADVRNRRRIEVEAILGNAVRLARDRGVVVTRLEGLYVLAKALDENLARVAAATARC
ncbi:hypothetical protein AAFC00_003120 [Neodothiora populina]|uniref:2-dehydropantoate 2-reductase n=1 Tax=Neodothiora populina TaxID=2781224 RepID=A0ABR3P9D0_9PEZI